MKAWCNTEESATVYETQMKAKNKGYEPMCCKETVWHGGHILWKNEYTPM